MKKPNILIIMPDQMGGNAGLPEAGFIMPNLRKLGADGINFTKTYCVTTHCCPSRASFMTGEYPSVHGIWNNVSNRCAINRELNEGIETLGEYLNDAGYNTGYYGKWHVNYGDPVEFGWQRSIWSAGKSHWKDSIIKEYDKMQQNGTSYEGNTPDTIKRPGWGDSKRYSTKLEYDEHTHPEYQGVLNTVDCIKDFASEDKPWCVMFSCNPPHDSYHVPECMVRKYDNMEIPLPVNFDDDLKDKPRIYQRMRYQTWNQMDRESVRECIKHYRAYCSLVDSWLGDILDTLESTGQAENTIVVFTSDHGDYSGEHGLWSKGIPAFNEGYHIPNVIRWSQGIAIPGRRVEELVSTCDFMPTLVELATGKVPEVYGNSLLPLFSSVNPPTCWRDELHFQMNGVELYYTQRTVMTKKWKYVYNGFDFDEMYNLNEDSGENINLAFPDRYEQAGVSTQDNEYVPYPRMTMELEKVRKEMYRRMWKFARKQEDHFMYTPYITTSQAAYGPLTAFEKEQEI